MSDGALLVLWIIGGGSLLALCGLFLTILERHLRVGTRALQVVGAFLLVLGVLLFLAWKAR